MKNDSLLGRNYLKGPEGDAMNALLVGCGHNLRKLLAFLRLDFLSYKKLYFCGEKSTYLVMIFLIVKWRQLNNA